MNRLISILIALAIVVAVLFSTLFVVDQRQYAIVFALGEVKEVIDKPGLHFKLPPPFQNVIFIDKRILTLDTPDRSEEHTSELQSLMRISYAVFCLKKTTTTHTST